MTPPDARRTAALLADRAAAVVRVVGRAFGLVILLGLASGLAVLALYATFDSSGARAIGIVYAVAAALAIGRLAFHRITLGRALGRRSGLADELERLVGRATAAPGQATEATVGRAGPVVVRGADDRSSPDGPGFDAAGFRRMDDLRQLNAELDLAGLARRTTPLRPRAIGLSTLAVLAVVVLTMAAPLLLVIGLVAKLAG